MPHFFNLARISLNTCSPGIPVTLPSSSSLILLPREDQIWLLVYWLLVYWLLVYWCIGYWCIGFHCPLST